MRGPELRAFPHNQAAPDLWKSIRSGPSREGTLDMHTLTTGRAKFAADSLVRIEIAFGTLSFWDHAIAKGDVANYLIAALLTWAFACVSLLVSSVVTRYAEAEGHKLTQAMAAYSGGVLVLIAGGMTFHGLAWADEKVGLAPMPLLVLASFLLSVLNVISLYVFVREIEARRAEPKEQGRSADVLMFGAKMHERETLKAVVEKMKASGAI